MGIKFDLQPGQPFIGLFVLCCVCACFLVQVIAAIDTPLILFECTCADSSSHTREGACIHANSQACSAGERRCLRSEGVVGCSRNRIRSRSHSRNLGEKKSAKHSHRRILRSNEETRSHANPFRWTHSTQRTRSSCAPLALRLELCRVVCKPRVLSALFSLPLLRLQPLLPLPDQLLPIIQRPDLPQQMIRGLAPASPAPPATAAALAHSGGPATYPCDARRRHAA